MKSEYLNERQLSGLRKVGNVLVPGDGDLPEFSESNSVREADRVLRHMNPDDRSDFLTLMSVFSFLPAFVISLFLRLTQWKEYFPGALGRVFRMIDLGITGVVYTLYYSDFTEDERIFQTIGWDAKMGTTEGSLGPEQARSTEAAQRAEANRPESLSFTAFDKPRATPAGESQVEAVFDTVRHAQGSLRKTSMSDRTELLDRLKKVILAEREWIIDEILYATGKSRSDALVSEIFPVLDHLHYLANNADETLTDEEITTPIALMGKNSKIYYEPLGTVLVISPWNYPFYQAIVPATSAFVAGNTVVYKPSEHTPMEGVVEELLEKAGFDEDWIQVVYGDGQTGASMIDQHPDKIFFTGSQSTGKKIMEQASDHLIPVELELGGKDPMIVFDDANIERSTAGAVWGGLTCAGQACTSVEKLYVQEDIYDDFKQLLLKRARNVKQDVSDDEDCDIGRMTTACQVETVREHVSDAADKGATVLTGEEWDGKSPLIPPIIVEDVTDEMLIANEETFGPVIPLYSFETEDEVIARANDTQYGLSASVWSDNQERADRVARAIKTGNVSINNVMITEGNPALPFGGTKTSGFGRYKGEFGLRSFCNVKSVMSESNSGSIEANWFPYDDTKYDLFTKMMVTLFTDGLWNFIKFVYYGLRLENYAESASRDGEEQ